MSVFVEIGKGSSHYLVNVDAIRYVSSYGMFGAGGTIVFNGKEKLSFAEPYESLVANILAATGHEKIENSPHTPLKDKRGDGSEHNPARTREGNLTCEGFLVPTLDEVKSYAATLGITDETATDFWYLFDGQGWKTKNGSLIHNWRSMLMSFNRGRKRLETNDAKRTAHIDAKMDEREAKRERRTGGGRRKADNNVEMSDEVREEVRRDFTF